MTSIQKEELNALGRTPEEIAARTAEIDARLKAEREASISLKDDVMAIREAVKDTPAPPLKPAKQRRPPVKGVCVNCGKNYSRHPVKNEEERLAWCTTDLNGTVFSLERVDPPAPAATAGALTEANAMRIWELNADIVRTFEESKTAQEAHKVACEALRSYLYSLTGGA